MDLLDDARALAPEITRLRHRLHRRPELGLLLPHTQEAVLEALADLPLEITTGTSCTSVTAVLRGTAPARLRDRPDGRAPVTLLRADMDALPVTERVDLPYRSEVPGRMHACGHDLHTAMLVGAAHLLVRHRDRLPGDVVLMFQPGEEGFDGAGHMIAEGGLDAAGSRPSSAFALHVLSGLARRDGVVTRPGALMAASDALLVTVHGRGGHGASPHLAADPVPAACEMVGALSTALDRRLPAHTPVVLTVGVFTAGTQRNVIPETARFEATVRTFDPAVRARVREICEQVCYGIAAAHDVRAEVDYREEYPVTITDPGRTALAMAVGRDLFGPDRVTLLPDPMTGSEDFSRVLAQVPGTLLFLGAAPDAADPATTAGNHSPTAVFDDATLPDGAAFGAALAMAALSSPAAHPAGVSSPGR